MPHAASAARVLTECRPALFRTVSDTGAGERWTRRARDSGFECYSTIDFSSRIDILKRRMEALTGEGDVDESCAEVGCLGYREQGSYSSGCNKDGEGCTPPRMNDGNCNVVDKDDIFSRSERFHISERNFADYIDEKIRRFEELFLQPVYHDIQRERSRSWYSEGRPTSDQTMNKEDLL